jgi:uncharacterized protein
MPRRLIQKIVPAPQALRDRWFLRLFGERIADPALWSLHRRAVTYAFGAGLAISFVPLPVHFLLAALIAVLWRVNLPVTYGTTFLVNPFTAVPVYYAAYRVGAALLHLPRQHFHFHPTWEWLRHGLVPVWQPFVVGCIACAVVCGLSGWLALEVAWRWHVTSRYRARHAATA